MTNDNFEKNTLTPNEYQEKVMSTAIWPADKGLEYLSLGLAGEVGEITSIIAKAIRDNNGKFTEEKKEKLFFEIGDAAYFIAALAYELGFKFEDVLVANNKKLADRQKRGVLGGDGDNR